MVGQKFHISKLLVIHVLSGNWHRWDKRIEVRIASGVKQLEPADVMRGEETQVAGLLLADQSFRVWYACQVRIVSGAGGFWANSIFSDL